MDGYRWVNLRSARRILRSGSPGAGRIFSRGVDQGSQADVNVNARISDRNGLTGDMPSLPILPTTARLYDEALDEMLCSGLPHDPCRFSTGGSAHE